jgi:hypothetical protein
VFVVSEDPLATQRRSLVCGIIWCRDAIAINTKQLCILLDKCKSSVNTGFTAIGYRTVLENPEVAVTLARTYPFMRSDFSQTRQWTFRSIPAHRSGISFSALALLPDFEVDTLGVATRQEFDDLKLDTPPSAFTLEIINAFDLPCSDACNDRFFTSEQDW